MSVFQRNIPPPFDHQAKATGFRLVNDSVLDTSDPGTGKTRASLDAIKYRRLNGGGKTLVLAPKSILQPAWGNDCFKFTPELTYSIATAKNRAAAFEADADVYITNHDAVKWIRDNAKILHDFDTLIIDESTAFKNAGSQRSKALKNISKHFKFREALTGTPTPNSVLDIWHQVLVIDDGAHLGTSFWKFRSTVCEPQQVGPRPDMIQWADKAGSEEAVADILEDITIRNKFEDCIDIPENVVSTIKFDLNPKHLKQYNDLEKTAVLELQNSTVSAISAGSLANKLLQLSSGAVYDEESIGQVLSTERYELVMELVKQRPQSVVAFNWRHQREQLTKLADKLGINYAVIDGSVSDIDRIAAVNDFQNGKLQVLFAHPQSAGHGLTLTKGVATIWASPTYNAEHFQQFNRRIYRAGQTQKTETILITANNTMEDQVYQKLMGKLQKMDSLLDMLQTNYNQAA